MRPPHRALAWSFIFVAARLLHAASAEYQIVARYHIGGSGGYDYLRADPAARRLYVSHDTRFEVLDVDTGRKVGEIGPVKRAHGVALSPETGHGFATSGNDNRIAMFDLKTLAVIKWIDSTGTNPDAIEFDPQSRRVYAANHGSGDMTVIDSKSGDVVGTIKLSGKLEGIAFDGRGHGFVLAEDESAVHMFDTQSLQGKSKWSLAPGDGGTGLAIDATHHRLIAACDRQAVILDSDTGRVVATPAIGAHCDGLVFEPKTRRIFTSNGDGTLTIIQQETADRYTVLQNVKTSQGCKTIALDDKTGRLLTSAPQFGPAKPGEGKAGKAKATALPDSFEVIVVGPKA